MDIAEIVERIAPKVSNLLLRSNADRTFFLTVVFPLEARQTGDCRVHFTAVDR